MRRKISDVANCVDVIRDVGGQLLRGEDFVDFVAEVLPLHLCVFAQNDLQAAAAKSSASLGAVVEHKAGLVVVCGEAYGNFCGSWLARDTSLGIDHAAAAHGEKYVGCLWMRVAVFGADVELLATGIRLKCDSPRVVGVSSQLSRLRCRMVVNLAVATLHG